MSLPSLVATRLLGTRSRYEFVASLIELLGPRLTGVSDVLQVLREPQAHGLHEGRAGALVPRLLQVVEAIAGEADPGIPTDLYGEIGSVYRQQQRPDLARKFYDRALENAKSPSEKAAVLNSLGILAFGTGDRVAAHTHLTRALSICEKNGIGGLQLANVLNNLSNVVPPEARESLRIRAAQVTGTQESELASTALLALAEGARERGDMQAVRHRLAQLHGAQLSVSDWVHYHRLRRFCFDVDPEKPELLERLHAALSSMFHDTGDSQILEVLLADPKLPLAAVSEGLDAIAEGARSPGPMQAAVSCLFRAARQRSDFAALATATLRLVKVMGVGSPTQRLMWLHDALNVATESALGALRFRLLIALAEEHMLRAATDPEHELSAAVVTWEAARALAPEQLEDANDRAMLAHCYLRFASAYSQLAELGKFSHRRAALANLETAARLAPPGDAYENLRQEIANNLANARVRLESSGQTPVQSVLAHEAAARTALLESGMHEPLKQCQLLLNAAQDYRELAATDTSQRRERLELARSYATQAQHTLTQVKEAPTSLQLASAAISLQIALDAEAAVEEVASGFRQLDALLPLAQGLRDAPRTATLAFEVAANAANRLGKRGAAYRRLLSGLRRLRAEPGFESSVRAILHLLVDGLLERGETARALYFLSLSGVTCAEEPRAIPPWRRYRTSPGVTCILWYFGQRSWGLVVNESGVSARSLAVTTADAVSFSARWLTVLDESKKARRGDAEAAAAWREAIGTVGAALGWRFFEEIKDWLPLSGALYLVPPEAMRVLPLHLTAIRTGANSFRDLLSVVSVAYARHLSFKPATSRSRGEPAFAAAYSPPEARLPFSVLELAAIQGIYGKRVRVVVDDDAKQDAVLRGLQNADVAHLSCHGVFELAEPLNSFLHFSDSPITLREVRLALSHTGCRMIVLSACEIGTQSIRSDDLGGFPGLLLAAGAEQVIAARCSVDDVATCLLMSILHRQLVDGKAPASALALAQAWLRTRSGVELADVLRSWTPLAERWLRPGELEYVEGRIRALAAAGDLCPFASPEYWGAFGLHLRELAVEPMRREDGAPQGQSESVTAPKRELISCPRCSAAMDASGYGLASVRGLGVDGVSLRCAYCGHTFHYDLST